MDKRKNLALLLGLLIPIVMVILVGVSIYLPKYFTKPKYDFLYSIGNDYYGVREYFVDKEHLQSRILKYPQLYAPSVAEEIEFYHYDMQQGKSIPITLKAAKQLHLDSSEKSPDGFELTYSDGINTHPLFYSAARHYHEIFIKGHNLTQKLNIRDSFNKEVYIYGWILKEQKKSDAK